MTATSPTPSPIPALIHYYERLRADPDETVPPIGFSVQKISFRVVIEPDGLLHAIEDARQQVGNRLVATPMIVPGQSKPSGPGINPRFLWDNAQYMLGVKFEDPKPERTAEAHEAFRQRHLDLVSEIEDEDFAAVCRFLERWDPAQIGQVAGYELLQELGGGFGVFQIRGRPRYPHERPAVTDYWHRQTEAESEEIEQQIVGQSLASGRDATLARLHEPECH